MQYKLPANSEEFYSNIEQAAHERWDKTPISAMVFGPDINSNNDSSILRKHIIDRCNEYGILVRTEHEDFVKVHRKLLGTNHNLCGLEYLAAKHIDAIVMIPNSPGSFIELGMFALINTVCVKTIILFSDEFSLPEKRLNFVFLGPKLAYEERKAQVEFIDYKRTDLAWEKVRSFLHQIRAKKWDDSTLEDLMVK